MYFKIYDWMVSDLDLKGNELIVYALITSFQDQNRVFYGSLEYIKKATGIKSKETTRRILKNLVSKDLLIKTRHRNGCEYRLNQTVLKNGTNRTQNEYRTVLKNGNNNTIYNTNNNIYNEMEYSTGFTDDEIEKLMED